MHEDTRNVFRRTLHETERVKYKRARTRDETLKLLAQGKSVEVSQTEMEALSKVAANKGTNVRTQRGAKPNTWYVTVLDPSKIV